MTCAPSSFYSGKSSCHRQPLTSRHTYRPPSSTASGPWCPAAYILLHPQNSVDHAYSLGRCDDGRRGRWYRNDAGSCVRGWVGWALNTRDVFAIYRERRVLYEQATDKVRKKLPMQPRSRNYRLRAVIRSWSCTVSAFLALGLCAPP